jgi:hypothetical protein
VIAIRSNASAVEELKLGLNNLDQIMRSNLEMKASVQDLESTKCAFEKLLSDRDAHSIAALDKTMHTFTQVCMKLLFFVVVVVVVVKSDIIFLDRGK